MLDATNPFFTDVAQGIEDAAERSDLSLFICNSDNRADRELSYLHRLEQQRVQGILITPVNPDDPSLDEIARHGTPMVIVDRVRDVDTHCSVAVDDVLGGRLAVEHLLDLGHRRIAFVGGPLSIGQVRDRLAGARAAIDGRRPLPRRAGRGRHGRADRGRGAGRRRTDRRHAAVGTAQRGVLRQRPARPRPAPAVRVARRPGARGPRDRRLRRHRVRGRGRGAADLGAAATACSSGRQAAELLIEEATDPEHRHQQVLFTPELVVRRSTLDTSTGFPGSH